jgi:hypothetical protein
LLHLFLFLGEVDSLAGSRGGARRAVDVDSTVPHGARLAPPPAVHELRLAPAPTRSDWGVHLVGGRGNFPTRGGRWYNWSPKHYVAICLLVIQLGIKLDARV